MSRAHAIVYASSGLCHAIAIPRASNWVFIVPLQASMAKHALRSAGVVARTDLASPKTAGWLVRISIFKPPYCSFNPRCCPEPFSNPSIFDKSPPVDMVRKVCEPTRSVRVQESSTVVNECTRESSTVVNECTRACQHMCMHVYAREGICLFLLTREKRTLVHRACIRVLEHATADNTRTSISLTSCQYSFGHHAQQLRHSNAIPALRTRGVK